MEFGFGKTSQWAQWKKKMIPGNKHTSTRISLEIESNFFTGVGNLAAKNPLYLEALLLMGCTDKTIKEVAQLLKSKDINISADDIKTILRSVSLIRSYTGNNNDIPDDTIITNFNPNQKGTVLAFLNSENIECSAKSDREFLLKFKEKYGIKTLCFTKS